MMALTFKAAVASSILLAADAVQKVSMSNAGARVQTDSERPLKDIYVFGGQSNCVGVAPRADIPQAFNKTPDHVFAWPSIGGTAWKPYSVHTDNGFNFGTLFGAELSFIQKLAPHYEKRGESFGVVKVAKVGASLQKQWARKGWEKFLHNASAMGELRESLAPPCGHQLFESRLDKLAMNATEPPPLLFSVFLDSVKSAMHSPQCAGNRCRIKALIWVQGEADSKHTETGALYKQNLQNLFGIVRKEWESPDMFVAIAQLAPFCMNRFSLPGAAQVVQAQQEFVSEEGTGHAGLVPSDGLTDGGDRLHYNAQSYIELGLRAAKLVEERLDLS